MQITMNKQTALFAMRLLRANRLTCHLLEKRCDIASPDPLPGKSWSKSVIKALAESAPLRAYEQPISVAVPAASERIRSKHVECCVYERCVPQGAFLDIGNGLVISGPELLFVELASSMRPVEHLMLGHEICGTFGRDAASPYNGPIAYGLRPLTSVERIAAFLDKTKNLRGSTRARKTLERLNDNAWSPTESLVAALFRLPIDDLGYDLGPLILNPRIERTQNLPGSKTSRVPDIVIAGTDIGVNYDGLVHLDLDSIAKAALEAGANPGARQAQAELNCAISEVREKVIDDIRRNRELATEGKTVFPLVKEDLYVPAGLDRVVAQLLGLLESQAGRDMSAQRLSLRMKALCEARYRIMLSLLPGRHERDVQVGRFIGGHKVYDGPSEVCECWIEL